MSIWCLLSEDESTHVYYATTQNTVSGWSTGTLSSVAASSTRNLCKWDKMYMVLLGGCVPVYLNLRICAGVTESHCMQRHPFCLLDEFEETIFNPVSNFELGAVT